MMDAFRVRLADDSTLTGDDMKTTQRKGSGQARRLTASADRPNDGVRDAVPAEPRCYAPPAAPVARGRDGLFTGGATLH